MTTFRRQNGFSLIEMVMIIVLLGIAGTAILGQFAMVGPGLLNGAAIQTAAQLAQERAEEIMAARRGNGYAAVPLGTTNDALAGGYAGYSRTVEVTAYSGPACPVADCRQVAIRVSQGGTVHAEVDFMVANY